MKEKIAKLRGRVVNFADTVGETNDVQADVNVNHELKALGVQMNSTLQRLINKTPKGIIQAAMELLREAQATREVKKPGGFLNAAIRDEWKPNKTLKENNELALFNEWWPKARQQGIFTASEQVDGIIYIYTMSREKVTFRELAKNKPGLQLIDLVCVYYKIDKVQKALDGLVLFGQFTVIKTLHLVNPLNKVRLFKGFQVVRKNL
ncbi:MAG: hypothetical protein ABG776_19710 [Cyanobacteria bacterium J06555_13]